MESHDFVKNLIETPGLGRNLFLIYLRKHCQNDSNVRKKIYNLLPHHGYSAICNIIFESSLRSLSEFIVKLDNNDNNAEATTTVKTNGKEKKTFLIKQKNQLKKWPIIQYFTKYRKLNSLKSECQNCVQFVGILVNLIYFSYEEDQYGVVRARLSDSMNCFIKLSNSLDNYKLSLNTSRINLIGYELLDSPDLTSVLNSCKFSIQSGIYRIAEKFGKRLKDIEVKDETRRRLQLYAEGKI
ncbi:unnamed protein product [Dimorphilus gyrociliatus]|uniref:Uncharacterized protein n=1 Tax=Dimorphilus gyrociliatus TaxID=2664684 RepID=A0A7I8VGD8_9ANNE|nr:unnamed protein product [Dimorphilus gyrociliatus]